MTWRLDLPLQRPLSMNDRGHWAPRSRETRQLRDAVHVLAKQARIGPQQRISVQVVYVPQYRRRRDPINLMRTAKAVEDGLVDAKVIPDDTPEHCLTVVPAILDPDPATRSSRIHALIEAIPQEDA